MKVPVVLYHGFFKWHWVFFVTTLELPILAPNEVNNLSLTFDCNFDNPCRWGTIGRGTDRWRLARGQPDFLLWLAATGTSILPSEPFTLIELQGGPADMLSSHQINCQIDTAMFSFTYWTIGSADLQICLLDETLRQFNCTGILESQVQPGKVALKIPPIDHPFHIAIIPDVKPGILVVDDIKYDAEFCQLPRNVGSIESSPSPPLFPTSPQVVLPWQGLTLSTPLATVLPSLLSSTTWTPYTTEEAIKEKEVSQTTQELEVSSSTTVSTTTFSTTILSTTTTEIPITTTENEKSEENEVDHQISETRSTTETTSEETTEQTNLPDPPFDLFIYGNKTQPLFDRRRGKIIEDTQDLLCDFGFNFPCFWGPEAGRWAIIEKGAIPDLEENTNERSELPAYPAAIVIQGTAMFASDPLRCQTGPGKLMFRYWANKKVTLQVCALGYNLDSNKIQCAEQHTNQENVEITLSVFDLIHDIYEPFTLNIVPMWERSARNGYLVLDEIAYMGECNTTLLESSAEEEHTRWPKRKGDHKPKQVKPLLTTTGPIEVRPITSRKGMNTRPFLLTTPSSRLTKQTEKGNAQEITNPPTTLPSTTEESPTELTTTEEETTTTTSEIVTTTRRPIPTVTFYPGMVVQRTTLKNSFTIPYTTTPRSISTTTEAVLDYCKLLNCDFNDNACRYLNHGLTKVPWTLRNKGYGFPLSRHTDLRPTPTNGQFVSTILGPGDFAILESPRFNLTQGINASQKLDRLLNEFDSRPTHSSTIRLCLGTRYTKPLRTISSFIQCPPILRSLTSKNAFKWNNVHIQIPPGTTHFYLVAHNLDRSTEKSAIAIDNIRVAICDSRTFDAVVETPTN
ncbi:MAM domain-containing protein [Aphelenchoides besseyi]|nr:MAM domain-containing protein [Aphelenchoides besseyi]